MFHVALSLWSDWACDNKTYQALKKALKRILTDQHALGRLWFDSFMILLVLSSVGVLVLNTRISLGAWVEPFEWTVLSIFIVEYLLRFWTCSDVHNIVAQEREYSNYHNLPMRWSQIWKGIFQQKWQFLTSPLSIIDLLAILPVYRPLRLFRLLLLFRIFKLFRYSRVLTYFSTIFQEKKVELRMLLFVFLSVIFISATILYEFESAHPESNVNSFFDAIYWSLVTISTVGYGDITPSSVEGKTVTMVLIVFGIALVSFFTSMLVSGFNARRHEFTHSRLLSEVERTTEFVLICGYGRIGQALASQFTKDQRVVVIEQDLERVELARRNGVIALHGDASDEAMLDAIGMGKKATFVLCLTSNDVTNLFVTLSIRQSNAGVPIYCRVNSPANAHKMKMAGATYAINPYAIVAEVGREYVQQPVAFKAVMDILTSQNNLGIEAIRVSKEHHWFGHSLSELDFTTARLIFLGVLRAAPLAEEQAYAVGKEFFYFNLERDYVLQDKDSIIVVGDYQNARQFAKRAL